MESRSAQASEEHPACCHVTQELLQMDVQRLSNLPQIKWLLRWDLIHGPPTQSLVCLLLCHCYATSH